MMRRLPPAFAAVLLLALAACGPGTPDEVCTDGDERVCYSGPDGTSGVGLCRSGVQTCVAGAWSAACVGQVLPREEACDQLDNDCNGKTDEFLRNGCGGCTTLPAQPGAACEACGVWVCDGTDAVICEPPAELPGGSCTAINGCAGIKQCGEDGVLVCIASEERNECGVCGGGGVSNLGEYCAAEGGCEGELVCSEDGLSAVCSAPSRNNCGACHPGPIEGIGEDCLAANGCPGVGECSFEGDVLFCRPSSGKNDCGVCGGPPIDGLGGSCEVDGCFGTMVCNVDGTASVCSGRMNNCERCNEPDVPGVDESCIASNGCEGVGMCDPLSPTKMTCFPLSGPNECGLCGGPPVLGLDTLCSTDGCPGRLACSEDKQGAVCDSPGRNACGACGPALPQLGQSCTAPNGCEGVEQCKAGGLDTTCVPTYQKNACEVCGPVINDLYQPCEVEDQYRCQGFWDCSEDGMSRQCVQLEFPNECGLCGGDPVPGLGDGCFDSEGCPSVRECTAGRDATECVLAASCSLTDHLVISEVSGGGPAGEVIGDTTGSRNEFVELYNPTDELEELEDYTLWYRVQNGDRFASPSGGLLLRFTGEMSIPARGYFLVGGYWYPTAASNPRASDVRLPQSVGDLPRYPYGGQVWLLRPCEALATTWNGELPRDLSPTHPCVVDVVGWGGAGSSPPAGVNPYFAFEGSGPAGMPTYNAAENRYGSVERKAFASSTLAKMLAGESAQGNGYDSNDNAADFVVRTHRDPQNSKSAREPNLTP